jgi:hypothetical protein
MFAPYYPKIIESTIAWPLVAPEDAAAWKVGKAPAPLLVNTYP